MNTPGAFGGRHLNAGIRGGLFEVKHWDKMGDAIWLFGWLVHRQTKQRGLVLGGHALTYREIQEDTGYPERTLRRWMARLQREGYVSVKHSSYCKLVVTVLNAKKFNPRQLELPVPAQESTRPEMADSTCPSLADTAARSGRLKEGAESEQKIPRSKNHQSETDDFFDSLFSEVTKQFPQIVSERRFLFAISVIRGRSKGQPSNPRAFWRTSLRKFFAAFPAEAKGFLGEEFNKILDRGTDLPSAIEDLKRTAARYDLPYGELLEGVIGRVIQKRDHEAASRREAHVGEFAHAEVSAD